MSTSVRVTPVTSTDAPFVAIVQTNNNGTLGPALLHESTHTLTMWGVRRDGSGYFTDGAVVECEAAVMTIDSGHVHLTTIGTPNTDLLLLETGEELVTEDGQFLLESVADLLAQNGRRLVTETGSYLRIE